MSDRFSRLPNSLESNERAAAAVAALLSSAIISGRDVTSFTRRACERLLFLLSAEDFDSMSGDTVDDESESDERLSSRRRIGLRLGGGRSWRRSILEEGAKRIIMEVLVDPPTPSDCGPACGTSSTNSWDQTATATTTRLHCQQEKIGRLLARSLLDYFGHHSCSCSCHPEGRSAEGDTSDNDDDDTVDSLALLAYNPLDFSKSPLHHAAFGGNAETTQYLLGVAHFLREVDSALVCSLRCGNVLNSDGNDEHVFVGEGKKEVVEISPRETRARLNILPPDERLGSLGFRKGHIAKFINNALLVAADEGEVHNVRALVETFKADINNKPHGGGHRALHLAAANGHEDVVLFFLSIFDKKLRSAHLSLCSSTGLLEDEAGIDSDNWAFERESKKRQMEILTAEGGHGMLPIHVAAMAGRQDIIRVLALAFARASMSANEDVDSERELEKRLIHHHHSSLSLTALSVEKAVSVGYGPHKLTSMHTAAAYGHVEVLKVLADLGADVNHKTVCACGVMSEAHSSPLCCVTALQLATRSATEELETIIDAPSDSLCEEEEEDKGNSSSENVGRAAYTKRLAMTEYPPSWISKWSAVISVLVELGADLSQLVTNCNDTGVLNDQALIGVLIPSVVNI